MRRTLTPYGLLGPGALWLVLFFVVPMFFMAELSLRSGTFNTGFVPALEFSNYGSALTEHTTQFIRSFYFAGLASLIALLIAYPLAYAIVFKAGRFQLLMLFAVVAPFFTTYLVRTLAWKTILADESPVVSALQAIQVIPADGRVLATSGAVIAGLVYNFLPFMILPVYASLERLDTQLIEAAKDLYASATQTFLKVTLPLTAPGIVAGILLTFIPAVGDYVNAELLGGTGNAMIGNVIQSLYLKQRDYPEAAALSFTMMIAILAVVLIYLRLAGSEAFLGEEADEA